MPIRVEFEGAVHEFPDGTSDADIASALQGAAPAPESPTPIDDSPSVMESQHPHAKMGRFVRRNLPTLAAAAGVAATPLTGGLSNIIAPAAVAGLAGAGGRATQILLDRIQRRPTPEGMDAVADIAGSGAGQAALTAGAGALGAGAGWLGPKLYRGLAKPVKALRDSFGAENMVKSAIEQGAPLTERGAAKMAQGVGASRSEALGLVQRAHDLGDPGAQAADVIQAYRPVVSELRRRADIGQANELARVGARGAAITKTANRTQGIPLPRAQQLKETAQDAASGAYRKLDRGTAGQLSADDLLDEATAKGLRQAIEARVPGVSAVNAETQRRLGGLRMIEDAVQSRANNNAIGGMKDLIAIGGGAGLGELTGNREAGIGAGSLLALLSRPGPGSMAAIGLDRLSRRQLDQWLRAALLAAQHGQE